MRRKSRSSPRVRVRPRVERLEGRALLAQIDLAGTATAPYGVVLADTQSFRGAGYAVAAVGDVDGDGYDDALIGAPTVRVDPRDGTIVLGQGGLSRTYLVFGSRLSQQGNVDFLTLAASQRNGDLMNLGNIGTFNGLTFTTAQNGDAQLGASVAAAGDVNRDGHADFLIGAPGARDASGAFNGAGRAYLVFGGKHLRETAESPPRELANKQIDLENPMLDARWRIVAFVTDQPGAQAGMAVAGIGDINGDSYPDLAIGAPNANGFVSQSGAVYVVSGASFASRPAERFTMFPLQSVGQPGGRAGVILVGAASGDRLGAAVAPAGDVNGRGGPAFTRADDFLIGAPGARSHTGTAYLVYGSTRLFDASRTVGRLHAISAGNIGAPSGNGSDVYNGRSNQNVPGLVVNGTAPGDQTGFALSAAGDFDGSRAASDARSDDILIGSPGYNRNTGRVSLCYGQVGTNATPWPLSGVASIQNASTTPSRAAWFDGAAPGAQAGYAVSAVGKLSVRASRAPESASDLMIGSPGLNRNTGAVYLIPHNATLVGAGYRLVDAEASPLYATVVRASNSASPAAPAFLGAALSGRVGILTPNNTSRTWDRDKIGDILIGAPGFSSTQAAFTAGAAYALQGTYLPLRPPPTLGTLPDRSVLEGTPLTFRVTATGPGTYSYSLASGTPAGATIDASRGIFTWTPNESQGPRTYTITVLVTDRLAPDVSAAHTFTVTVGEANAAPVLAPIATLTVVPGGRLSYTVKAVDPDLPSNRLRFSLVGAPEGAAINANTGLLTWRPNPLQQRVGSHTFRVRVTDSSGLSDERSVTVVIRPKAVRITSWSVPATNRIVLGLSDVVHAGTARMLSAYRVVTGGRDGRLGTSDDQTVPLKSAAYRPGSRTIALNLAVRIPSRTPLRLIVDGDRLLDPRRQGLDGDRDGIPGGAFVVDWPGRV